MAGLRDYQQRLLEQAEIDLQPPSACVMVQLPTGGGKTHIAGVLLRRWLRNGSKAVWLTHRAELADQTCRMLTEAGVSSFSVNSWQAGNDAPSIVNGTVILMAQTVGRRTSQMQIWGEYRSGDLLVIDEAHHAAADSWERAIEQWPGRVVGLTATPWRLSAREGFDHLFSKLHCGPQVSELQADGWLCQSRVLMPGQEEIIRGGRVAGTGDYNERGILQANREHPDVMTAGALRFWQFHAGERQTVVYAISQDHARNLTAVFNEASIPSAVMLSDTLPQERTEAIESFGNGTLRVLVNVAVATEGFDLPNASCVVITRPTMSLALYLQMVGRGLRPKTDGGDCLILDLAGNAELHGLPEERRQWSLSPRGIAPQGDAPVIRCENCDAVSPAASHACVFCQSPFGKDCARCGQWRATERWSYETYCGSLHDLVCNLCHLDAHIQGQLPVTDELRRLTEMEPDLDAALRNLLEEERRRTSSADEKVKTDLRSRIAARESELSSDSLLQSFKSYIAALPEEVRPKSELEEYRLFPEWEVRLKHELADWKDQLGKLGSGVSDGRLIYNSAKDRVLQSLESVALQTGLLPHSSQMGKPVQRRIAETSNNLPSDMTGWVSLVQIDEWNKVAYVGSRSVKPSRLRDPQGREISVRSWADLLHMTARWLMEEGILTGPFTFKTMTKRNLIHPEPFHPDGRKFKLSRELPNDLFIDCNYNAKNIVRLSGRLLAEFGQDPAQFHVLLG